MKYLISASLFFIALNVTAQSNFQTGYVVTKTSDTISGLINYRSMAYTMQSVILKASSEDKTATSFLPADLKSFFVIPGNFYISYAGKISNNKTGADMDMQKDTTTSQASIFLQQIAKGTNINLYINTDRQKSRFFIKEKDSLPVELLYYHFGRPENPQNVRTYINQLTALYMSFNPDINKKQLQKLKTTEFEKDSLIKAVNIINNYVPYVDPLPNYSRFFIGASLSSVSANSDISGYQYDNASKLSNTTISPKISVGFDVGHNPGTQRATFRTELGFSMYRPRFPFTYSPNSINYVGNNVFRFDQYSVSLTPQFLYNIYNNDAIKFFVGVGVSAYFNFYANQEINYNQLVSTTPIAFMPAVGDVSNPTFQVTVPLQVGIVLKKRVELMATYCPPTTIGSAPNSPRITSQSFGVGIHYLLQRKTQVTN
jgi:hypothetical protein